MAAPQDNQNAKKKRLRVPVVLSIADERLNAIVRAMERDSCDASDYAVRKYVKKVAYQAIDAALSEMVDM